jgi:tRNA pseudouridine55 synthase
MSEAGVVVINKERGWTSHDVVAVVRGTLRLKAGHTGTLDPQAEGVLPVCVGSATKLSAYLASQDKTYIAKVHLGVTTDTDDTSGQVLTRRGVSFNNERITEAVTSFIGEQYQTPPMYSAVKVNGKKLYELARKGQNVERQPRKIFIASISVLDFFPEENAFTMEVNCSKGTYIRSLCADIGEKLDCGGCMGDLLRTRSGRFTLEQAVLLKDLTPSHVIGVKEALPYPGALAAPEAGKLAANGNPIPVKMAVFDEASARYWLYSGGALRGLYSLQGDKLVPEVML